MTSRKSARCHEWECFFIVAVHCKIEEKPFRLLPNRLLNNSEPSLIGRRNDSSLPWKEIRMTVEWTLLGQTVLHLVVKLELMVTWGSGQSAAAI